ncbi:MAG: glycosyltransferase family 1 protein [Planctomycetaceae bacterium]|nr:MAG: glycosyltransferase family 1 protein [Planctomycetaceae bacterium]
MKICHVITRLILGGAQENTLLTCEGLHALGHDVTLVTGPAIGPEGELLTRAQAGGYRVIVLDEMRREINIRRDWTTYRKLVEIIGETQPDVVHTHSSKAGILARRAAKYVRARSRDMAIVHTIHGLPFHPYQGRMLNGVYVALERQAARYTDAIISVADAMTRQALAAGVGRPEQYTTIYSGMDVAPYLTPTADAAGFRAALHLPPDAVLVTQVSRLAELKGHEFIIRAASKVPDRRVHFCFVGDGNLRAKIEADITAAGLSERFHLTGLLPPEQIPAVMAATDILVHCSLREGLARTLPQAMLAGKPVISYDVDGAGEVVTGRTGALLSPREIAGLRDAIIRLAGDADLRQTLGSAARELCRERFDHNRMVEQIEAVYKRLVGQSGL